LADADAPAQPGLGLARGLARRSGLITLAELLFEGGVTVSTPIDATTPGLRSVIQLDGDCSMLVALDAVAGLSPAARDGLVAAHGAAIRATLAPLDLLTRLLRFWLSRGGWLVAALPLLSWRPWAESWAAALPIGQIAAGVCLRYVPHAVLRIGAALVRARLAGRARRMLGMLPAGAAAHQWAEAAHRVL
jgi:hypothetical protein